MANMLQSSQTQATNAPGYYTDYLSNLATKGQDAAGKAQFVGAQPLQTQAFCKVATNFGAQQPAFQTGQGYVGQAAGQDVTGAASPYLTAGTTASPLNALDPYAKSAMSTTGVQTATPLVCRGTNISGLSAADPYLQKATTTSPADLASQYMNPFINTAVQSLSDIGQRNIRQNIAPAATAAAVGSGQFGSQRGAQVMGQMKSQAEQDLNSQISQLLSQGYGQALCAAGKQNALTASAGSTAGTLANQQAQNLVNAGTSLGTLQQGANTIASNLGSTASQAQTAQNQANLTAAQTAAQAAANEGQLLNTAGANMGSLGTQAANTNLACINALSTLGGQQQTIGQNEQNFPLTNLASLSNLLQGYSIPTSTSTTLCMSPISGLAAAGTGLGGLLANDPKTGKNMLENITGSNSLTGLAGNSLDWLSRKFSSPSNTTTDADFDVGGGFNPAGDVGGGSYEQDEEGNWVWVPKRASGGSIQSRAMGGLVGGMPCMSDGIRCMAGTICTPYCTTNASPTQIMGCASTQYRGGLPTTRG